MRDKQKQIFVTWSCTQAQLETTRSAHQVIYMAFQFPQFASCQIVCCGQHSLPFTSQTVRVIAVNLDRMKERNPFATSSVLSAVFVSAPCLCMSLLCPFPWPEYTCLVPRLQLLPFFFNTLFRGYSYFKLQFGKLRGE